MGFIVKHTPSQSSKEAGRRGSGLIERKLTEHLTRIPFASEGRAQSRDEGQLFEEALVAEQGLKELENSRERHVTVTLLLTPEEAPHVVGVAIELRR